MKLALLNKESRHDFHHGNLIQKLPNYRLSFYSSKKGLQENFTAIEHRIIVLALAQITPQNAPRQMYPIFIKDVFGEFNPKNYKLLREYVTNLQKTTLEVEDGKWWRSFSLLPKIQGNYADDYIEIQFHQDIQKFLLALKSQYSPQVIQNVINFKNSYSLRIYEMCKQFEKTEYYLLAIEHLKHLLGVETQFPFFSDFENEVLTPAIEEINKFSDIDVVVSEVHVDGKSVNTLMFAIKIKTQGGKLLKTPNPKKWKNLELQF